MDTEEGRSWIAEGIAKGIAEGITKGIAKGKAEGKAEIARNLKALGLSQKIISQSTGLTLRQIQKL